MNELSPITRRVGVPIAPPPPELPADIPGIAAAIEEMVESGAATRMNMACHAKLRSVPGRLLGAHEALVVELAAVQRQADARQRTVDLLTRDLATERGEIAAARLEIIEGQKQASILYVDNVRLNNEINSRWHPTWFIASGSMCGVATTYLFPLAAIYIDRWEPVVAHVVRGFGW